MDSPAQIDAGRRPGLTLAEFEEFKRFKREKRDFKGANEILNAASIFFAGELDPRRHQPSRSSTRCEHGNRVESVRMVVSSEQGSITLGAVQWYNAKRLHSYLGNTPLEEFGVNYAKSDVPSTDGSPP